MPNASYAEQEKAVRDLISERPDSFIRFRAGCPFCNGYNTLSVTKSQDGAIRWNCFHYTCKVKGTATVGGDFVYLSTMFDAAKKFNADVKTGFGDVKPPEEPKQGRHVPRRVERLPAPAKKLGLPPSTFTTPDGFIYNVGSIDAARDYLASVNCWEAYNESMLNIQFDTVNQRVVFMHSFMGRLYGGSGRYVGGGKAHKWHIYPGTTRPFLHRGIITVPAKNTLILVEDCPSATVASNATGYDAMALLGTNITPSVAEHIACYASVIIALDKDATEKAIESVPILNMLTDTSILPLERDLKVMSAPSIVSLFRKHKAIA